MLSGELGNLQEFTLDGILEPTLVVQILNAIGQNTRIQKVSLLLRNEFDGALVLEDLCKMLNKNKSLFYYDYKF